MKNMIMAAALLLPLGAQAGGFMGVDYVRSDLEPRRTTDDAHPRALQLKLGIWFNRAETVGWDFRLGTGVEDGRLNSTSTVEIDRMLGSYFRAQFPASWPVRPYGLVGFSRISTTTNVLGGSAYGTVYHDLSFGVGADVSLTSSLFVGTEFLQAMNRDGKEASNFSLSINHRF